MSIKAQETKKDTVKNTQENTKFIDRNNTPEAEAKGREAIAKARAEALKKAKAQALPDWMSNVNLERPEDGDYMVKLEYRFTKKGLHLDIYFPTGEVVKKFTTGENVQSMVFDPLRDWFGGTMTDPVEILEKARWEAFPISYRYDNLAEVFKDVIYIKSYVK